MAGSGMGRASGTIGHTGGTATPVVATATGPVSWRWWHQVSVTPCCRRLVHLRSCHRHHTRAETTHLPLHSINSNARRQLKAMPDHSRQSYISNPRSTYTLTVRSTHMYTHTYIYAHARHPTIAPTGFIGRALRRTSNIGRGDAQHGVEAKWQCVDHG